MHVIACDIGTTGVKTYMSFAGKGISIVPAARRGCGTTVNENGGVEQDEEIIGRGLDTAGAIGR